LRLAAGEPERVSSRDSLRLGPGGEFAPLWLAGALAAMLDWAAQCDFVSRSFVRSASERRALFQWGTAWPPQTMEKTANISRLARAIRLIEFRLDGPHFGLLRLDFSA